jgi:hypothetical protein
MFKSMRNFALASVAVALTLRARAGLTEDDLKLLQDPGGWQYISLSDADAGIQTTHTCFDGRPHPDECSGTLTLKPDETFVQQVYIHHQTVARHGTYEIDGTELLFFDEFGTRDGPYQLSLDRDKKLLELKTPQVRIQLELDKEYRKQRQSDQQYDQPGSSRSAISGR